jgi:sulfur-carrier protein
MPTVKFTSALKKFFPTLTDTTVQANTVRGILVELEQSHPGITSYLVDDAGQLRQHVNVFIQEELIHDRETLSDPVHVRDTVTIFQALSGG